MSALNRLAIKGATFTRLISLVKRAALTKERIMILTLDFTLRIE